VKIVASYGGQVGLVGLVVWMRFLSVACLVLVLVRQQPARTPDIFFVPTRHAVADEMLKLAGVNKTDVVYDLGAGDGRILILAAQKYGARGVGIELDPQLVAMARQVAEEGHVADRVTFVEGDLFTADISAATVVTLYLSTRVNQELEPKLRKELKPGTRIVSNTMGDWKEDERAELNSNAGCNVSWCTALLWIVPARVAGQYKTPRGEVVLKQSFQMLSGTVTAGGRTVPLTGKVNGTEVSFTAGGKKYSGHYNGKNLELK